MDMGQTLVFRPSRRKIAGMLLASFAFVVGGIVLIRSGHWVGWLSVAVFGLGVVVFALQLLPQSAYLRVGSAGFTVCTLFRAHSCRWSDVGPFKVARVGPKDMVVFSRQPFTASCSARSRRWRRSACAVTAPAVSFLEAAINELFQDVADAHESYVAGLDPDSRRTMSEFWNFTEGRNRSASSLLDKYQMALTFLRKPHFEPGQPPYQDASLVVRLRNELVHYKPRSLGGDAKHTLAQQLGGKFADNALMAGSGNPWFPDKCLGHGCADWSVRSVVALADNFFGRIAVDPNYQRVQFQPSPDEA